MYKLRHTAAVEAVWDSLPAPADEEFSRAIIAVCEDPWAHTEPRDGDPRDVRRILILQHTVATLLIMDAPPVRRVYLRHVDYLG
ncbi:hypothetical protein ACJ6WF_17145 [Streptomyces sp. MMS24-I2-30]|uniref:hypothetical protein n=1 Tax=Streptomyces sp. MMS24-I2-30 TaxID=3351564 RepID=UPI0038969E8E